MIVAYLAMSIILYDIFSGVRPWSLDFLVLNILDDKIKKINL